MTLARIVAMVVILMTFAACASPGRPVETWVFTRPGAPATLPQAPLPEIPPASPAAPVFRDVVFPLASAPPDPARLETLAQFALDVAAKGEIVEAATFLTEAADQPAADSERQAFRVACLAGAASLYLRAGDVKSFRAVAARLRAQFDRYQLVTLEPNIAALLAIASVLDGQRVDGPNVPGILRDLRRPDIRGGR